MSTVKCKTGLMILCRHPAGFRYSYQTVQRVQIVK